MVELDVPAMIHVSGSCNRNFHATGALSLGLLSGSGRHAQEAAFARPWDDERLFRHLRLSQPGIDLLFKVIDIDNILFGSEMVGAVRDIDPETGHHFDDTKRYLDHLGLSDADRHKVFEGNARRVYPRLDTILKGQGR